MLIVLEEGKEKEAKKIFDKWNLDFAVIGKTTDSKNIELFFKNEKVAEIPINFLAENAPMYDRKWIKTELPKENSFSKDQFKSLKLGECLKKILQDPKFQIKNGSGTNMITQLWVTIQKPGGDAGVVSSWYIKL